MEKLYPMCIGCGYQYCPQLTNKCPKCGEKSYGLYPDKGATSSDTGVSDVRSEGASNTTDIIAGANIPINGVPSGGMSGFLRALGEMFGMTPATLEETMVDSATISTEDEIFMIEVRANTSAPKSEVGSTLEVTVPAGHSARDRDLLIDNVIGEWFKKHLYTFERIRKKETIL